MKHLILAGLSMALSAPFALPATAVEQPVNAQQTINKQAAPETEQMRQELIEELDTMFEQERQEMMTEMDTRLDQMHQEMVRIINERFREATERRLNR